VANDERSAAFMALGMAQAVQQPTLLICTSGTAGLNYSPAVAEAHYQQVPLLVCTADRPPEWIDQWDGQTLRQQNLFADRVNAFFQLPVETSHPDAAWQVNRVANDAYWKAIGPVHGPVHLNFPFREPFYPQAEEAPFPEKPRVIEELHTLPLLGKYHAHELVNEWLATEKKMVVVGQMPYRHDLANVLYANQLYNAAPLVADVISNAGQVEGAITHADLILMQDRPDLAPDLLVTVGQGIMSKNLKLALRQWKPKQHWHIQPFGHVADTYQSLTRIIRTDPVELLQRMGEQGYFSGQADNPNPFYTAWQTAEASVKDKLSRVTANHAATAADLTVVHDAMSQLPDGWDLHLANSMSVRYANFSGLPAKQRNLVFASRGTSGIDGCTSTAVGYAMASGKNTLLITGDVAFFYDRNALWQQSLPKGLKILLLNNGGGNIFRMIDGPARQPELEHLFETWQGHTAASLAQQAGIDYQVLHHASSGADDVSHAIGWLYSQEGAALLEIITSAEHNQVVFAAMKQEMKA
jgi:2-succinyl-5-enolpyruvyl-6-hydroxy-3-cyclohexene-1-carboxylate synthase